MKKVKDIDLTSLKEACKALNEVQDLLEEKIKYVGVKGQNILDNFVTTIEAIPEQDHENIPAIAVDVYNDIVSDEIEAEPEPEYTEPQETLPEDEVQAEETVVVKEEEKPKKKAKKKKSKSIRVGNTTYGNFQEYANSLKKDGPETPTNYLDLLLLDGATAQECVDKFAEFIKANNISHGGYKRPSLIVEHINARTKRAGFVFEQDGDVYTLVGHIGDTEA